MCVHMVCVCSVSEGCGMCVVCVCGVWYVYMWYMCACGVCGAVCVQVSMEPWSHGDQKWGIRSFGTGVLGICEWPHMGAGIQTLVPDRAVHILNH